MVEFILKWPRILAFGIVAVCFLVGLVAQYQCGNNYFERLGTMSVGISVLMFGLVVADLINRGQGMDFARLPKLGDHISESERNALGGLRSWQNVNRTLNAQAAAVGLGTVQSAFGSLILGVVNAHS